MPPKTISNLPKSCIVSSKSVSVSLDSRLVLTYERRF
jgi:hypothetical protein